MRPKAKKNTVAFRVEIVIGYDDRDDKAELINAGFDENGHPKRGLIEYIASGFEDDQIAGQQFVYGVEYTRLGGEEAGK
jgi:hypothetical protein